MSNYFFDAFPSTHERLVAEGPLSDKIEPGLFAGAGSLAMRGLAETGRAVDLLGMVGPVAQDWLTGGTAAQDAYGREHDEVFNAAVDYWTPDPASVHWSGQVVGGVVSGLAQFAAGGPALVVGTQQLSSTEDLVRQGVGAGTAQAVGLVQGATAAVGIWAPFVGSTWTRKALSGLAANVPLGMASRGIPHLLLAKDHPELAEQYKALDPVGLSTDIAMALAFSGVAQLMEVGARRLSQMELDGVTAANQAKHLEIDTLPGVPKDGESYNAHSRAMFKAIDDLIEGRAVDVSQELKGAEFDTAPRIEADAQRAAEMKDLTKAYDDLPPPKPRIRLKVPPDAPPDAPSVPIGEADLEITAARQRIATQGDIDLPVGYDAEGNTVTMKASEALKAEPDLPPNVFQAAITCFLGG